MTIEEPLIFLARPREHTQVWHARWPNPPPDWPFVGKQWQREDDFYWLKFSHPLALIKTIKNGDYVLYDEDDTWIFPPEVFDEFYEVVS